MTFAVGQRWTYAAPADLADSRIVIGALLEFEGSAPVACCTVTGAVQQQPDGSRVRVTVPFLPLTIDALARTVTAPDGDGEVAPEFSRHFESWQEDPRGLTFFTVPFEGSLDRMIAMQMREIVDGAT